MQSTTTTVTASDGIPLHTKRWLPEGQVRAVVQIAHGMAEHSGRYARLAQALTGAGYAVYATDHRGHGDTGSEADRGYFADEHGWDTVVADLRAVTRFAQDEHPGLPVFLLGHSTGSFLSRSYVIEDSRGLAGLVLSGTTGHPGVRGRAGVALAALEARIRGRRHPSTLLDGLAVGSYNNAFKPIRTNVDWLSRDPDEVDLYVADPHCGYTMTTGFFADLAGALLDINDRRRVARVRRDLPILLVSGDEDPVGANGKGVRAVAEQYRSVGVVDVTCTLYPGARHEIFNETNRDEVTSDVVAWLDAHLPA
jgi:alpha-beta hydrolase superfamily lysophospholipase